MKILKFGGFTTNTFETKHCVMIILDNTLNKLVIIKFSIVSNKSNFLTPRFTFPDKLSKWWLDKHLKEWKYTYKQQARP